MDIPQIGQIVHYTSQDGFFPWTVQPAIVLGMNDDTTLQLWIFYKVGTFYLPSVAPAEDDADAGSERARGKWVWPRVAPPSSA